jgi:membrane protein DedA with SNARE-associated domain
MQRNHVLWIFGVRCLYGIRWLGAALAGSSRMSGARFAFLSIPACLIWALLLGLLGYAAGEMVERLLGDVGRYELVLAGAVALVAIAYGLLARRGERRLEQLPR